MSFLAALAGVLTGVITGLLPGLHVNTVTALLLGAGAACAAAGFEFSTLLAFICALAISHTFFDVVPGLFLGVPGDETFALLPGHRMVRRGEGLLAVRLSVTGSGIGLVLGLLILVLLVLGGNVLGAVESAVRPVLFFVLAAIALILIVSDRPRGLAAVSFFASGALGVAVFGSPLVPGGLDAPVNSLFPSLAGLFGVAGLLFAIRTHRAESNTPPVSAEKSPASPTLQFGIRPGVAGAMAGLLVGLLPGLGAANAATLLELLGRARRRLDEEARDRAYLVTTSSLNTSEALFAIGALYIIGRSRSGASVAVEQVLGGRVDASDVLYAAFWMFVAGGLAGILLSALGGPLAALFGRLDPIRLNYAVITLLAVGTFWLLGLGGLAILIVATLVGLIPLRAGARRAQLMGFFLVPTMLFYSGYERRIVDLLGIEGRTAPLLVAAEPPPSVVARIVGVVDGDTVDIASGCRRFRVRLKGVDAPELNTPSGQEAAEWLREFAEGEEVRWQPVGMDVYGRFLGEVALPDGTDLAGELIGGGHAAPRFDALPRAPPPGPPGLPPEVVGWDDNGNGRISCAEARRHGIAPVRRGHPAYPFMNDADGDGVVCE